MKIASYLSPPFSPMLRTPNYGRWIIGNFGATLLGPTKKLKQMATETVSLKVIVDDTGTEAAFNRMTTNAEQTQSAVDKVGQAGTEAFGELSSAVGQADKALADGVRTLGQYKTQMTANEKAIAATNALLNEQRTRLKQMQAEYNSLTNRATDSAKKQAQAIETLTRDIRSNEVAVSNLTTANEKLQKQSSATAGKFSELASELSNDAFGTIGDKLGLGANVTNRLGNSVTKILPKLARFAGGAGGIAAALLAVIAVPVGIYLTNSQKALDFFADKMAYASGILKELKSRLFDLGESLVGLVSGTKTLGEVSEAAANVLSGGYAEAGRAAQDFERIQRRILADQEAFIVKEAVQTTIIDERRRASDNENLSIRERTAALKAASRQEGELESERLRFARAKFDRLAKEGELGDGVATNLEEQRKLQAEIIKLQSSAASREFSDQQAILSLRREGAERAKQQREEQERLNEAVRKFREQLQVLQNSQLGSVAALRAQGDAAQAEIDKTEASLMKLYAEQKRTFDLQSEFAAFRVLTAQATEEKITAFIISEQDKRKVAESQAIRETEQAQKESLQNRLDAIGQQGEALAALQKTELAQLGVRKVALEQQASIAQQAFLDGLVGSDVVLAIRRQLATIQDEYNQLANVQLTGVAAFKQKLFTALGLDEGGQQQLRAALSNVANNLVGLFDTVNQSRIDALNAEIAAIDDNINKLQERVDEERKRQQDGYANDLALVTAALEDENKARAAALKERGEQEAKAAKSKLALDSAQQASDIVSASISLAASGAKAGVVGLIAALGGIALLARIIAQGKQIARQNRPQFREGTEYLIGQPHELGGIPIEAEGGERMFSKKLNSRIPRHLSNEKIVDIINGATTGYQSIGRQVAGIVRPDSIAAMVATIVAEQSKAQEAQRREEMEIMSQAYEKAAISANDRVISYWKTRPVKKMAQGGEVYEYHEGGRLVRQFVAKAVESE